MAEQGAMQPVNEEQKQLLVDVLEEPGTEGISIGYSDKNKTIILAIELDDEAYELIKRLLVKAN